MIGVGQGRSPEKGAPFLCAASCRESMSLKQRMGRTASREKEPPYLIFKFRKEMEERRWESIRRKI